MPFIYRNNGYFYVVELVKINNIWCRKYLRRATESEIKNYLEIRNVNKYVVSMICDNPLCDNIVKTTRARKIKLNTEDVKKGKLEFVYCSKKCRHEHLLALTIKDNNNGKSGNSQK